MKTSIVTPELINQLKSSGNWMVRFSNGGKGYNDFLWSAPGEWTICPWWSQQSIDNPSCESGGLFGQGPGGYGYCNVGNRFEFCMTSGNHISVGNNKIKVEKAMILATDQEAFEMLVLVTDDNFLGSLDLGSYRYSLPAGFTHCGGSLDLLGYNHPLPAAFTHCGGYLHLGGYNHPLPAGFTHCDGSLNLRRYNHPLPAGFTHCGGYLDLWGYNYPLPAGFTHCGGYLYLGRYNHPLPVGFTHCGGYLNLQGYNHPLPAEFTHCGGYLYLGGYDHPLPAGFTHNIK